MANIQRANWSRVCKPSKPIIHYVSCLIIYSTHDPLISWEGQWNFDTLQVRRATTNNPGCEKRGREAASIYCSALTLHDGHFSTMKGVLNRETSSKISLH